MFEGTAILKKAVVTQDENLNEVTTYTERTVFVRPRSVLNPRLLSSSLPLPITTEKNSSSTAGKSTQSRGSIKDLTATPSN